MNSLLTRDNDALEVNPPVGLTFHLSRNGSNWLWAVTAVFIVSFLAVVALTYLGARKESRLSGGYSSGVTSGTTTGGATQTSAVRSGDRIFHYLFAIALFVGSVGYFTIASDLGWTGVSTSNRAAGIRQVFYARYIYWFVGWTPLIIALGIASGVSWATIIYNVALLWIWVATWLSGALISSSYKWGYFAFGIFAYLLLAFSLVSNGGVTAKRLGIKTHYTILTGWLVSLWFIYPIGWGLDEGNVYSVTSAYIYWGILDLLTVPGTIAVFLVLSRKWDYEALNIHFTRYGRVLQHSGTFPEKQTALGGPGAQTGTTAGDAYTSAPGVGPTGTTGAPQQTSAVGNNVA